jgi:RNAse (barnase) inhibitor barstar
MSYKLSNRLHFIESMGAIENDTNSILFKIDGKYCDTKEKLFNTFSDILSFPSYFGKNWDAFNDCIHDLEWIKNKTGKDKINIYICNLSEILKDDSSQNKRIFFEIINKDYTINKENEQDIVNFPTDINFFMLIRDMQYYISNNQLK